MLFRSAKQIQNSILSEKKVLDHAFPENFIFYQPSAIVSGDFYYFQQIHDHFVIAVADCTGHGVPGGFMTMLGITFVDEIVRRNDVNKPGKALEILREHIKSTLRQEKESSIKDGMDIAMCAINTCTNEMEFAGANLPVILVKNKEKHANEIRKYGNAPKIEQEDALLEIKPDRMPIGFYYNENSFTNYKVQLEKGDLIYMFTDGYMDQFGGSAGRKFLKKNFKKIISEISVKPLKDQGKIIKSRFFEWKGYRNQIDDVLVLGIRI